MAIITYSERVIKFSNIISVSVIKIFGGQK